jgi:hypothetical protein
MRSGTSITPRQGERAIAAHDRLDGLISIANCDCACGERLRHGEYVFDPISKFLKNPRERSEVRNPPRPLLLSTRPKVDRVFGKKAAGSSDPAPPN